LVSVLAFNANGNATERAVIHIESARPGNLLRIKVQIVAVKQMSVNQRREQVVRGSNSVEVAVKVQVDLLAGLDLGEPATRGSAFHPKDRSQRWLTRADD